MHIPDGILDFKTAAAAGMLAAVGVGWALWESKRTLPPRRVPLVGLAAAFIFAAQMLNFPVIAGASGHLIGGVLAAVLLGPATAIVVITCVLILQCLAFSDGGVLALGANVFNMALVGAGGGWLIYRGLRRFLPGPGGELAAAAFAAWAAVVAASASCAAQLAASGQIPARAVLPAMAGIHMVIGLGEAAITALALSAIRGARPELLQTDAASTPSLSGLRVFIMLGILFALGLALFVAPLASSQPDGLEWAMGKLGMAEPAPRAMLHAPAPDYQIPGIGSPAPATALAGAAGTLIAFILALVLARTLTPKPTPARVSAENAAGLVLGSDLE